jgi:N-acetylglucosamine-6-phosphate deacetylase
MKAETKNRYILQGNLVLHDRILMGGFVVISDGIIAGIEERLPDWEDAIHINAGQRYISPGFIDIHVHGGGGHDFMDGTTDALLKIAELHALHGTTSMLPTTLTADLPGILQTIDTYRSAASLNTNGAAFLGLHLEGPYFSMAQRGAQDPRFIRDPDPAEYLEILKHDDVIRRWSIAPEKKGAIELGKLLTKRGILPSMAHTDAVYEEAREAYENGYSLLTHFYSAMSGVTRKNAYRYAGVIEAGYLHDDLDVEIIADGVHLPAPLLKLICKIKGPEHIALITDAMRGAGMPEGPSILGHPDTGMQVIIEDGVAKLPDRSAFAGSVATADRLVRTMLDMAEVSLIDAIRMITATPARILKMEDRIGSIAKGMHADLVIFNDRIEVQAVMLKGKFSSSYDKLTSPAGK